MFKEAIQAAAAKHELDPAIVYGVCMQESTMDQDASRYEAHYRWTVNDRRLKPRFCTDATELIHQKTSWGLMQVMGAVFREHGFSGWLSSIPRFPETQLHYGCQHLKKAVQRWGLIPGILAYNAGSPRKNAAGQYVNQYYYDRVIQYSKGWEAYV